MDERKHTLLWILTVRDLSTLRDRINIWMDLLKYFRLNTLCASSLPINKGIKLSLPFLPDVWWAIYTFGHATKSNKESIARSNTFFIRSLLIILIPNHISTIAIFVLSNDCQMLYVLYTLFRAKQLNDFIIYLTV